MWAPKAPYNNEKLDDKPCNNSTRNSSLKVTSLHPQRDHEYKEGIIDTSEENTSIPGQKCMEMMSFCHDCN